jgi:hypothetical protein
MYIALYTRSVVFPGLIHVQGLGQTNLAWYSMIQWMAAQLPNVEWVLLQAYVCQQDFSYLPDLSAVSALLVQLLFLQVATDQVGSTFEHFPQAMTSGMMLASLLLSRLWRD